MKALLITTLLSAVFFSAPALRAEPGAVRVRMEQVNKPDVEKYKRKQKRSLKAFLSNGSSEALELKVKFVIFGRDVASHDIVKIGESELPAALPPLGNLVLESKSATALSEDEHLVKNKKVEASGHKLIGSGVEVYQGEKLVAETFDPASLKEEIAQAQLVPKGTKKK